LEELVFQNTENMYMAIAGTHIYFANTTGWEETYLLCVATC